MNDELVKGTVVRYKTGWMVVTAVFKDHVNLGAILTGKTKIKRVPRSEVKEDYNAWFDSWRNSETYKCM